MTTILNRTTFKDILEWDVLNWGKVLRYWDPSISADAHNMKALDLGARHGGLSLFLALKGYHVICSDLGWPSEKAKEKHRQYSVSSRITYADIDATAINFPDNSFDIVIFKSLLGGLGKHSSIELQKKAVQEMFRVLKPGGYLMFAENLVASPLHKLLRKIFIPWASYWRYITISEMKLFLKDFSVVKFDTFGFFGAFGRNENQRKLFHYPDRLLNPVLPGSFKYIIYGYAIK